MLSASECLLKANNLEMAARTATLDNRMLYLQAAAEWRRRAHQILMEQTDPIEVLGLDPRPAPEVGERTRSAD